MSKGSGRRPEATPGAYADGHERAFGKQVPWYEKRGVEIQHEKDTEYCMRVNARLPFVRGHVVTIAGHCTDLALVIVRSTIYPTMELNIKAEDLWHYLEDV